MKGLSAGFFILLIFASPGAKAEWKQVHSLQGEYLFALSSVGPKEFFVSGMFIDPKSRVPIPQPRVYWTQDGGLLLKPIMGNLPTSLTAGLPYAIHFWDTKTGLLGMGKKVYRTLDRGAKWQGTDLGEGVLAVRFLSQTVALAAGAKGLLARSEDAGQTWTKVESGTDADIGCLFFVDSNRGFAAGARTVEEEDENGNTYNRYEEGVVLITSDGGRTWRKGFTTYGLGLCPLFFLKDGKTGWLAAVQPDSQPNGRRSKALLFSTKDGGETFEDTGLDVQVGILNFLMQIPLTASYFVTMYWEDTFRGHLAGAAYVVSISSGMGGEQHIYRVVDFLTLDGGKTWKKTDLGNVSMAMGEGPPSIQSDGQVIGGELRSLFEGWLVGENSAIWTYRYTCKGHADCGEGYVCNAQSQCEAMPAPPNPCPDGGCEGPSSPDFSEVFEDIITPRDLPASEGPITVSDIEKGGSPSSGCEASKIPAPLLPSLLLFALLGASRKRRSILNRR